MFPNSNIIKFSRIAFIVMALLASGNLYSQNKESFDKLRKQMLDEFDKARVKNRNEYDAYRKKINDEYVSFLGEKWRQAKQEEIKQQEPAPEPKPKPVPQPVYIPLEKVTSNPLPFVLNYQTPKVSLKVRPVAPLVTEYIEPYEVLPGVKDVVVPSQDVILLNQPKVEFKKRPYQKGKNNYVYFSFYGNECGVRLPKEKEIGSPISNNAQVAKVWEILSGETYNDMLVDLICIRESLSLCDWAFFQLAQHLTKAYFGDWNSNEAAVMQTYIMSQLGYKVRLAEQNGNFFPLVAFAEKVYNKSYFTFDGEKYYPFSSKFTNGSIYICDFKFPNEKMCSVEVKEIPVFPELNTPSRKVASKRYPKVSVDVQSNKNMVDFFNDYLACTYEYKSKASLSEGLKNQLYPSLKKAISGKSQEEAANILLDFVQTGFEYKTDTEQFGYEKSMFADETFFYPYSDCEDRAILYSILVKELIGLEVVLMDYPSHVATAVHFTDKVEGDFFEMEGKRYIVCDPTYIGAAVGRTMPDCKDLECEIIKL